MKYTIIKNIEELKDEVNNIFTDIFKDNTNAITKYNRCVVVVIFEDNTFFVYEPFECFDFAETYFNMFKTKIIKDIIIYNHNDYKTYTNITNNEIIEILDNWEDSLQFFMWETYIPKGYKDILEEFYNE